MLLCIHDSTLQNVTRSFWATVCKTVRPMLSVRCPVLSVCDVHALWPNGGTDQDETWHADRPRPWPHGIRLGSSCPPPKKKGTAANFWPMLCCGQTAGLIKMPLGTEVGLGQGDIVLDGDPAPPKKEVQRPQFWYMSIMAKRLDRSRRNVAWR